MLIAGQTFSTDFTCDFNLPRHGQPAITFKLAPLPLGFHQKLKRRGITPPQPPAKVARDSTGKAVRDANGQVVTIPDVNQSDYLNASELYHQRVAILSLFESLRNDNNVSFEAKSPTTESAADWEKFADTLFDELQQAGLSCGDLLKLCAGICRISNLLDDHIQEARANFSSPLVADFP